MDKRSFRLRSSEWLLTGSLLILLICLVVVSKTRASQVILPRAREVTMVDVSIDGHVKKPGLYPTALGTPIGAALKKAGLKKNADLRSISLKEPILQPLSITIEYLKELSIFVEGEVQNPGNFQVPYGSRISDLKKILQLSSNADSAFFKKKRLLQDGETISVPKKQPFQG
jgi:hypothetical protein